MARMRMVTRTIEVIMADVICMDLETMESKVMTLELTGMGNISEEKLMKNLRATYETEKFKLVAINKIAKYEQLYGLKEIDFLKYATKLDPETRKMLEEEEE